VSKNNLLDEHEDLLDVVLFEIPEKGLQYRMSVTCFREVNYLSIREWYASYNNEFSPSNNGFTVPYTLASCSALLRGLSSLLAKAEVLDAVSEDSTYLTEVAKQISLVSLISKSLGLHMSLLTPENVARVETTDNSITIHFEELCPKN
jgi:hypothetical protein